MSEAHDLRGEATRESTEVLRSLLDQLRRDIGVSGAGRDARPISAEVLAGLVEEVIERREADEATVVVPEPELVDPAVHAAAMERADRIARERDDLQVRLVSALRKAEQYEDAFRGMEELADERGDAVEAASRDRDVLLAEQSRLTAERNDARELTEHYRGIQAELLVQLRTAEELIAQERAGAEHYQEQRNEVSSQLNDMTDNRDMLKTELDELSAEHEALIEQASEAGAQRDRYLSERDRLRQHLQAEMAQHRAMGERAVNAERRLAVLADESEAMQRRAEAAEDDMAGLAHERDRLSASLDLARENAKTADDRVGELMDLTDRLKAQVRSLIEQRDGRDENIAQLHKAVSVTTAERDDAVEALSRVERAYHERCEERDYERDARQAETNRANEMRDKANRAELVAAGHAHRIEDLRRELERTAFERDDARRLLVAARSGNEAEYRMRYRALKDRLAEVLDTENDEELAGG